MNEITVFFRDDDVGVLGDPLRSVMELLLEEGIPCNYQVVPLQLDDAACDYARAMQGAHPDLVFFNQHGLRHEQEIRGEHRWSEFDGARPYEEQHRDIARGRRLLEERLGASFDGRIFTPPCHKYDEATLRALGELGFEILSAGVKLDPASQLYYRMGSALGKVSLLGKRVSYHTALVPRLTETGRLAEVSVCIDVDEDVDTRGEKIEKSADALWREFETCSGRSSVVGVMLHHGRYTGPEKVDTLRSFVRRLKEHPRVRFRNIQDIAQHARATRG
jgi:predicted deacetylase